MQEILEKSGNSCKNCEKIGKICTDFGKVLKNFENVEIFGKIFGGHCCKIEIPWCVSGSQLNLETRLGDLCFGSVSMTHNLSLSVA